MVITVSDGASRGERRDESGDAVRRLLAQAGFRILDSAVLPDERDVIAERLRGAAEEHDLIVTTGGTGLGPRDVTVEATRDVIDYEVPGIGELMRREGFEYTPMAALSRGLAGVRGHSLIVNLPGSPRGATESLQAALPVLGHACALLRGERPH
ncbi:MAG TPA: MogA/MoaB family molybdenum cofactor biosynthesis protein [Candidatus Dormibacteraeota bacterium]|jgi:molybdenum cofactor synthesis domain-containing protein|nr:MogA/MoaB family molybdenum cofactor biosynthesis protein [Candidatus Dormibacteraeota bacterium]